MTRGGDLADSLAERATAVDGDLPQVLHAAPAAVLMIDLERRQVVYANAAAMERRKVEGYF